MTAIPGCEEPIDLLELEQRKAMRNQFKAATSVKLKIVDDFKRRVLDRDFTDKLEGTVKNARKKWQEEMEVKEARKTKRDDKIK